MTTDTREPTPPSRWRYAGTVAWMLLALGVFAVADWLFVTDRLPGWGMFLAAVAAIAVAARAELARERSRPPRPPDALTPSEEFHVLRSLTIEGQGEDVVVTLRLERDHEPAGEVLTLRFTGVRGLSFAVPGVPLLMSSLRCDDRGPYHRRGPRYRVYDEFREVLDFACDAFESALRDPHTDPS